MFVHPEHYRLTPVYDLLVAASRGHAGVDRRLIRAIVARPDEAVRDLVRFAREEHHDDAVGLDLDVISILRHLGRPEAIAAYIAYARLNPKDIPDSLLHAFREQPEASIGPLVALYDELGEEAIDIPFVLASLGIRDDRIRDILLRHLEYDATDAVLVIASYGDPSLIPVLEKLREDSGTEADDLLRREINMAIEAIRTHEGSPPEPFDIWAEYPETEPPRFDLLSDEEHVELLGSSSVEYRLEAAGALFDVTLSEQAREALYQRAKSDPDAGVRAACWAALFGDSDREEIATAMRERLADEKAPLEERSGALIGLAMYMRDPDVRRQAEDFYRRPQARAAAMRAMRLSHDRTLADYFPRHLDDPDPEIRREAVWGVGALGIASRAEELKKFFDDKEGLRDVAIFSYTLATPHETGRAHVPGLCRKVEQQAGGLDEEEQELVKTAIDQRLMLHGYKPVFFPDEEDPVEQPAPSANKPGRNDPCPCGSGKKYKKCCGAA